MSKEHLSDHDLLMTLANDMMWVKRILFALMVPVSIQTIVSLLGHAAG